MQLRVIINEQNDGVIEAQLLEFDIATSAQTLNGLVEAISYAICAEYQIAVENDVVPFLNIGKAPQRWLAW